MAIISSYPTITPTSSDLVLVVDTSEDGNPTKTATVGSVNALATAPSIVIKTFTITGTALDNLGSTPVVLQALAGDSASGEYVQLIGASVFGSGGTISGNIVWDAAGATLTWRSTLDTADNRITIPQGKLPSGSAIVDAPYNIAALDGTWRRGGDIIISTAADPVKTGDTAGATLTINLTYRSFPQT
jgi:hypothetical protein